MSEQGSLVVFMPSGRRGRFAEGTNVLDAARELGVGIESICSGRLTCGKCKVRVEEGHFAKHAITSTATHLTPVGGDERDLLHAMHGDDCRLSCTAQVTGDVLIYVPEESRAHKQIIRKAAGERVIDIDPAVRQFYVQVEDAALGEHRGDWRRLQDALEQEAGLTDLTIDLHALRKLQPALRQAKRALTVIVWNDREVIDVRPGEWGGWGYRGSVKVFGRAAVVLRAGTGIRVDLVGGRAFAVTVDDAETGARLLNDLAARTEPG